MTIEEKIDNFKALLRRSYQAQNKEDMLVSVNLLEGIGLNYRELREVICPSLITEGFLRSFSLDLHILAKENLIIRAIDFGKNNINDMEFTTDIPSYEFTVNKEKLNRRFGASKKSSPPVFDLPPDSKWEDITIKFKDEENIDVTLPDKRHVILSFQQMGFGKKNPNPQWSFLWCLAIMYATHGQLDKELKDRYGVPAEPSDLATALSKKGPKHITKDNVYKIKESLSLKLQENFGIFTEPFEEDYKQWKYYRTKFELLPESLFLNDKPYEADKQMHNGAERVKYIDPTLRKMDGRGFSSVGSDDSLESNDHTARAGFGNRRLSDEPSLDDDIESMEDDDFTKGDNAIE
jgi:hypothetical protein